MGGVVGAIIERGKRPSLAAAGCFSIRRLFRPGLCDRVWVNSKWVKGSVYIPKDTFKETFFMFWDRKKYPKKLIKKIRCVDASTACLYVGGNEKRNTVVTKYDWEVKTNFHEKCREKLRVRAQEEEINIAKTLHVCVAWFSYFQPSRDRRECSSTWYATWRRYASMLC